MRSGTTWIAFGAAMAVVGLIAASMFKLLLVDPAYTPLPAGGHGETFGPISAVRLPVYAACGLYVLAGLALVGAGLWAKLKARS